MVFSSSLFLFLFLPILLMVYFLVREKFKNTVLLLASLFFYAWGEPTKIGIMLLSIIINYILGYLIETKPKNKKIFLSLAIVYNIGVLYIFKYTNFTVNIINHFLENDIIIQNIMLPIGISFFTFQIMSYVIDVYRGTVKSQRNILNLALYISLFPQLIAGPIVRYIDVEKQINHRTVTLDTVYEGFRRFSIGFSKKVLIADRMSPIVDTVFAGKSPSIFSYWIGIIAYSLQIFFDFSGYSDMAIGLGKIFGFTFLENFNFPYISQSIQEFWRRWHISLSSWFRDYLYIPLGGSRKGNLKTYINLGTVFFLTGLWHGASFNFIIWGLFYFIFLVIERMGFANILKKLPRIIRHLYALVVILAGWVFFRADTLTHALNYFKQMVTISGNDLAYLNVLMNAENWTFLIIGIIFCIPFENFSNGIKSTKIGMIILDIFIIFIFVLAIMYMVGSGFSPFLYFRF